MTGCGLPHQGIPLNTGVIMDSYITLTTKCGRVTGIDRGESYLFSGVPYATAERFELPVPVSTFGVVFDATKKPLEFPQTNTYIDDSERFYTKEFRRGATFEYAESPLTLSIITPPKADGCPVLIFIHGGGFENGKHSEDPVGTCDEYARRGIILVSISYRLNVFGLYRCANYFLYDQVAAIKWVRDNIADYGGNPESITLIGQSAGAISLFELLYTDTLKGIIKGAVMMSGAGFFPSFGNGFTREEGKPFWDRVMHAAGCENDEQMKTAPAETLWHAWNDTKGSGGLKVMQPGIDGKMIPDHGKNTKKNGYMLDIPVVVGVTAQDMLFPLILFNMANEFALWSFRKKRPPVYAYYFDHIPPGNLYKAYHACDLWYVFGNMDKCWRPWTQEDYELKDSMIDSIAQFVRTGEPGWAAFKPWRRVFRRFNTHGGKYIRPVQCFFELLNNSLFSRGPF